MEKFSEILKKKQIVQTTSIKPINHTWEIACDFGKATGLTPPQVLRLFKIYGQEKTLSIRGWLSDVKCDPSRGGKIALANWKLKNSKV